MNAVIESDKWCPDVCLITKRPFFMWLEHPTKGYVPTYGGPFDSYTLAEPNGDGTFFCERYDHDAGHWVDWTDGIDLRLIDNQREDYEYGTVATLQAKLEAADKDAARYRWLRAEHMVINPLAAVCWKRNGNRSESDWFNTVDDKWLDSAIDAVMQQESVSGKGE